jgi:hypothetical protein
MKCAGIADCCDTAFFLFEASSTSTVHRERVFGIPRERVELTPWVDAEVKKGTLAFKVDRENVEMVET